MSGYVATANDIIFAFDLDGTIANYGRSVSKRVANLLNQLPNVYIITGGSRESAAQATKLIKSKVVIGMRDFEDGYHMDLSKIFMTTKQRFVNSSTYQQMRKNLCLELRKHGANCYVGGRSTIDFMPKVNKGDIIKNLQKNGSKVVYFYDCQWAINKDINNDVPAVKEAWKSVKTDHRTICKDLKECLKTIS